MSIPSLLSGAEVAKTTVINARDAELSFKDRSRPKQLFNQTRTVLNDAHDLGYNVGIVGWDLPYCRLIPVCAECFWQPAEAGTVAGVYRDFQGSAAIFGYYREMVTFHFSRFPFARRLPWSAPRARRFEDLQQHSYSNLLRRALQATADSRLDFLFLHFNVPHPPTATDANYQPKPREHRMDYFDSLELADQTLGAVRRSLEAAGFWESTALLVTADHGFRPYAWNDPPVFWSERVARFATNSRPDRVPFLLKLPHQTRPETYQAEFNTVVTRSLMDALMRGQVDNETAVPGLLQALAGRNSGSRISRALNSPQASGAQ